MNNFFVTLFIGDRYFQYRLDELIANSSNGYINEEFEGNCKLYLPVQIKDDKYVIQNDSSIWSVRHDGSLVSDECEIKHGDYYFISGKGVSFALLVMDFSRVKLSSVIYSLDEKTVFMGRSNDMNIVLDLNGNISRKTAAIHLEKDGSYTIEDLSGKTGVYVNGNRVASQKLNAGDEIYIMGTTMVYLNGAIVVPSDIKTNGLNVTDELELVSATDEDDEHEYTRTPRILKSCETGTISIDPPTTVQKTKEIPLMLSIGPSLTMSVAMLASLGISVSNALANGQIASVVTSGAMCVGMLAGSMLWPNLLRKYNSEQAAANERKRIERYTAYLSDKENEIRLKYERNARVLRENLMPSPDTLLEFAEKQNRRLWERTPKDKDFLSIRLGVGERDFEIRLNAPKKTFTLDDDALIDNAVALSEKYKTLHNAPISVSLIENRVVGVVGESQSVANIIITNIVTLHAPDEVKLVLIYNPRKGDELGWAMNMPHVWSDDRRQRYVATSGEEAENLLSQLGEYITNRETRLSKNDVRVPHFVFLVMNDELIKNSPYRRFMINSESNIGVSLIFFGSRFSDIPKECGAIIQKDADTCGIYIRDKNENRLVKFKADNIIHTQMTELVSSINKIKLPSSRISEGIPERITFLDMYKVGNIDSLKILNRWRTNTSEKSLAAAIGVKAGGEVFSLDIHEKHHGCHGLVAGTTGSGKSEFLQAYILSMMINYSPNEVAFVLVDFKGGDMARPFLKSPHLAATISNLSGNTLYRALVSLQAEVKSRQNIFNISAEQLGIDKLDINSYQKYFKENKLEHPLPHLVIVIDEFAQLKTQHPEFMAKLIDIAQVGRSLGIHLILATQRPSGVVDPQIWSNSRFKVCLKVLDKQDSMDMINRSEAALIKQPGRGYVQVGYDEIFEQIQSGYSGADYVAQSEYVDEQSVSVKLVNDSAETIRKAKKQMGGIKSSRTQLEEAVSAIAATGVAVGLKTKQLWLPPLPEQLLLENISGDECRFATEKWDKGDLDGVICGVADMPEVQAQRPFIVDLVKNGHLVIYGSSGTGKSALVQTILFGYALKYSPKSFNVFVLDFGGGGLSGIAEMPHCAEYSDGSSDSVDEILNKLQAAMVERRKLFVENKVANYESYISQNKNELPIITVVLDNYSAFREKLYKCEDRLVQLVSGARSCGIYLIVTGNSKGGVYYKITEQISSKIVLNMNDSGAYRDILNVPIAISPESCKGRGLTIVDKKAVEVQFALPFNCEDDSVRTKMIQSEYGEMAKFSKRPIYGVPEIAEELCEEKKAVELYQPKQSPAIEPIDTASDACVLGNEVKTHRLIGFSLEDNKRVFVCKKNNRNCVTQILNNIAENTLRPIYLITDEAPKGITDTIRIVDDIDEFISEGYSGGKLDDSVVCIDGFCRFFDRISDEALSMFENALKNECKHTIITFDDMQRINDYRDTGLFVSLVRTDIGMVIGGGVDDALAGNLTSKIYEINKWQREKELPLGQAFVYFNGMCSDITLLGGEKS